jgi:PadR family transcriptional regulator, regulatory protein PadR
MKPRVPADESPLGTFEEQVMLAVLRKGNEAYATSVRRELEKVTDRSIAIGSVYVTLDRLEAKGLIASTRAQREQSISRRLFVVTSEGARSLATTRSMRDRLWEGVELPRLVKNA